MPRISSFPAYVSSAGAEAVDLAALAGLHLDEWQKFVLEHSLGERADGRWAAPTVGLVVGRQNGKNAVLEARELAGLFLLEEQVIIHSAHEQATSSEHFRRLLALIEGVPEFYRRVLKVVQGKGSEAIELRGGQRVLFKTRTGGGGRGFTADLLVFDEAMILSAAAKSALIPTLAGRSVEGNMQIWYAGSAADQLNPKHDGVELARVRENGIKGAKNVAYFEWSVPGDNPDEVDAAVAADPAVQALANPGLGIRISEEWIEHERTVELGAREFAVERLGVGDWPDPDGDANRVIDAAMWADAMDAKSAVLDPVCFAFDTTPDRAWSTISVAGRRPDGLSHVEITSREGVVDRRRGTGWLVARLLELAEEHEHVGFICDGRSPAGSLLPELEQAGLEVTPVTSTEHAQGCGMFFDGVEQKTLRHLGQPELTSAVRGAAKRPLGDAWAWSRKTSATDISPLVACTLALWGSLTLNARELEPMVAYR